MTGKQPKTPKPTPGRGSNTPGTESLRDDGVSRRGGTTHSSDRTREVGQGDRPSGDKPKPKG